MRLSKNFLETPLASIVDYLMDEAWSWSSWTSGTCHTVPEGGRRLKLGS